MYASYANGVKKKGKKDLEDEFYGGFHTSICCSFFCYRFTTLAKDSMHLGVFWGLI